MSRQWEHAYKIPENYVKSKGAFNIGKYKIACTKGKYFILFGY